MSSGPLAQEVTGWCCNPQDGGFKDMKRKKPLNPPALGASCGLPRQPLTFGSLPTLGRLTVATNRHGCPLTRLPAAQAVSPRVFQEEIQGSLEGDPKGEDKVGPMVSPRLSAEADALSRITFIRLWLTVVGNLSGISPSQSLVTHLTNFLLSNGWSGCNRLGGNPQAKTVRRRSPGVRARKSGNLPPAQVKL